MCGIAGFFTGCEMKGQCPHSENGACTLIQSQKAMRGWYEKASVRRSPRHMLNEDDIGSHLFPASLAPTLEHALVKRMDGERITAILDNHLFRYLDFTTKLEVVVVNEIAKEILLDHGPVRFDEAATFDAHKIYVDEAYHALFSRDLFDQAKNLFGKSPIVPERPRFLNELRRIISGGRDERERRLIKLAFVCVSETLITSSLTEIRKEKGVPEAIGKTITDHAMDEARHHSFFLGLIKALPGHLTEQDRRLVLKLIPQFIFAFVHPDGDAIHAELTANGLSSDDAWQVISETYTPEVVQSYARNCASGLLKGVEVFPEFREPYIQELFLRNGLLKENRLGINYAGSQKLKEFRSRNDRKQKRVGNTEGGAIDALPKR